MDDIHQLVHPIARRVPVRAVQELGESIGVELPTALLESQVASGYRSCGSWDGALHELGHRVLSKAHVYWKPTDPGGDNRLQGSCRKLNRRHTFF